MLGADMQLETIYVLEGLGPPKEHVPAAKSFKDQVGMHLPSCIEQICKTLWHVALPYSALCCSDPKSYAS